MKMMGPARVLASVTLAAAVAEETIPSERRKERDEGGQLRARFSQVWGETGRDVNSQAIPWRVEGMVTAPFLMAVTEEVNPEKMMTASERKEGRKEVSSSLRKTKTARGKEQNFDSRLSESVPFM